MKTSPESLHEAECFNVPPARDRSVKNLSATFTFNGVKVELSPAEALLCWHLCVAKSLTPKNKNSVIPRKLRSGYAENFLNSAAATLRNRQVFRQANKKGTAGDPVGLFFMDGMGDGVRFNRGVKVTFSHSLKSALTGAF